MGKWKRGNVVYIPFILPETWCLGAAFFLTFIASILMFSAVGTLHWKVTKIDIETATGSGNNKSYNVYYGVRRMEVDYCVRDQEVDMANEGGMLCGHETVFYTSCSGTHEFCKPAPASDLTFAGICIIASGIMCLAALICSLIKRYMHFIFHIPLIIAAPLGVAFARGGITSVELSEVLVQTGKDGTRSDSLSSSFNAAVVGCIFIWLAFILLICDFIYQRQQDNKEDQPAPQANHSAAPPVQQQPQQAPGQPPRQQPPRPGGHPGAGGI